MCERAHDLMYACTDIGCCGSTITPHPTLKSSHDRDDNYEDNDENVDDGDEARHKLRRASYRSAHVRAYVSRLIFKERDFMTIFIRGLGEGGTGTRGNGQEFDDRAGIDRHSTSELPSTHRRRCTC